MRSTSFLSWSFNTQVQFFLEIQNKNKNMQQGEIKVFAASLPIS